MARRRAQPEPERAGGDAPIWLRSTLQGLIHFSREGERVAISGPAYDRLKKARAEWCQAGGCWRGGTRTCAEVFGRPCDGDRQPKGAPA